MKKNFFSLLMVLLAFASLKAQVGIGTTTPNGPFTVVANDTSRGIVQKKGNVEIGFWTSQSNAYLQTWSPHNLNFATNNGKAIVTISNSSGFVGINNITPSAQLDLAGNLRIRGNGAGAGKVLTSDAFGNATWEAPGTGFSATLAADIPLADGITTNITGFSEDFDDGNVFNPTNGRFTAPSAGVYQVNYNLNFLEGGLATKYFFIQVKVNGSVVNSYSYIAYGFNSNAGASYTNSLILKLAESDYVSLAVNRVQSGGSAVRGSNSASRSTFSVHKLY